MNKTLNLNLSIFPQPVTHALSSSLAPVLFQDHTGPHRLILLFNSHTMYIFTYMHFCTSA